ncbi:GntP family permease [Actinomadura harenae]|uniref:GntP family permease n=1 Tax=Actinomadura harenae TaxID=2483351 RepID=UPI001F4063AF|nr:GntP family permease [Actinomadura harenae]
MPRRPRSLTRPCARLVDLASHVNDGGFWIVSRSFNLTVRDTLKTRTVLETILSAVGFAMAATLSTLI